MIKKIQHLMNNLNEIESEKYISLKIIIVFFMKKGIEVPILDSENPKTGVYY